MNELKTMSYKPLHCRLNISIKIQKKETKSKSYLDFESQYI